MLRALGTAAPNTGGYPQVYYLLQEQDDDRLKEGPEPVMLVTPEQVNGILKGELLLQSPLDLAR